MRRYRKTNANKTIVPRTKRKLPDDHEYVRKRLPRTVKTLTEMTQKPRKKT